MKRPTFVAFILIVVLAIAGMSYLWLKNSPEGGTEIKIGTIQIDYANLEELQRSVDEGHQPWRLNPLLVGESEAVQYGFTAEDIQTLSFPSYSVADLGTQIIKLEGTITHEGKTYLITVGQPFSGKEKIWTILKIQKQ